MISNRSKWLGVAGLCLCVFACDKKSKDEKAGDQSAPTSPATPESKDHDAATKAAQPALPDAAELLTKATQALGGEDKIRAVESIYSEGVVEVGGQNLRGDVKLWWKNGDFYTEQTMAGIGTIRAGKHGDELWSQDPITGLRKLDGVEAEQFEWASSPALSADWQRYFATATTVGEQEVGGKKAWEVKLTSKSGSELTLLLDEESGLPLAQKFEQHSPLGKTPVSVEFLDYRDVEGVKVPFQQVSDQGIAKATQTTTKLEFGAQVDAAKFAMPTGGAEVAKPQ